MTYEFNPFTGNLDQVGTQGATPIPPNFPTEVIQKVNTFGDLPGAPFPDTDVLYIVLDASDDPNSVNSGLAFYAFDKQDESYTQIKWDDDDIKITQTGHGYNLLQPLYYDIVTNTYLPGDATDENKLSNYIVTQVIDTDNFVISQVGKYLVNNHGLDIGSYYIEDPRNPGLLTNSPVILSGEFWNPILFVIDANTVLKLNQRPNEVEVDYVTPLPVAQFGFSANRVNGDVYIFDPTNGTVVNTINTGLGQVRSFEYNSLVKKLYVCGYGNGTCIIYDMSAGLTVPNPPVLNTITGLSQPRYTENRPGGNEVWIANSATSIFTVIDTQTDQVKYTRAMATARPRAFKFTPNGQRLTVTSINSGSIEIRTVDSWTLEGTAFVGGSPHGLELSGDGRYAYVMVFSGARMSKVDLDSLNVVGQQTGLPGCHGSCLLDSGILATANFSGSSVTQLDPDLYNNTSANPGPIQTTSVPNPISIDKMIGDDSKIYVASTAVAGINVIEIATNVVTLYPLPGSSYKVKLR